MKRRTQAKRRTRAAKTVRRAGKVRTRRHEAGRPERRRKLTQRARARRNVDRPRTAKQFFAMSKEAQDVWTKATHVVREMRRTGVSLRHASREAGVDANFVRELVGKALRKQRNGRYSARPTDRLLSVLIIPTKKGMREVATRDSRQATLVAEYWIAVHRYIDPETHDASALLKFKGKYVIDSNGRKVRLLTDLAELDRLGNAGVLSFETIYARR